MYCHNCGNKLEASTITCPKCGSPVERIQYKKIENKKNTNIQGLISIIFGIITLLMCINFMLKDISGVGMYTNIYERMHYAIDLVLAPFILSFITLIITLSNKQKKTSLNKLSLILSIISIFFIISEIGIVIIY